MAGKGVKEMVKNKIGIALTILLAVFGLTACGQKRMTPKEHFSLCKKNTTRVAHSRGFEEYCKLS